MRVRWALNGEGKSEESTSSHFPLIPDSVDPVCVNSQRLGYFQLSCYHS